MQSAVQKRPEVLAQIPVPKIVLKIAKTIQDAGGRALLVGGCVRDALMHLDAGENKDESAAIKDLDIEVFGIPLETLEEILSRHGQVKKVGRSFGVLRVAGLDIDFSMPRKDSKVGAGHRGFMVHCDPQMRFEEAARRRDLTINSMGLDPLDATLLDPYHGAQDLNGKTLRATDKERFSEDPLRGLRVAQFAARFDMRPDDELVKLMAALDLGELSAERLRGEMQKLLLRGQKPSIGFEILRDTGLLGIFPEIAALIDVPQDPIHHPEGDVWIHTLMVIDQAATLRSGDFDHDWPLMLAALCHDFGKPATTTEEKGEDDAGKPITRIRSIAHEKAGLEPTRNFLHRLKVAHRFIDNVDVLVHYHLAPHQFAKAGAGPKAYRRLARKLAKGGTTLEMLALLARADHFGRTTEEALAGKNPRGDAFLAQAKALGMDTKGPEDVVLGRHLIARGLKPGPDFQDILDRCREYQDEHGATEAAVILDAVLGV